MKQRNTGPFVGTGGVGDYLSSRYATPAPGIDSMHLISEGSLYDSMHYMPNTCVPPLEVLFQRPLGTEGRTKLQTNLIVGGKLQAGEAMVVESISITFSAACNDRDVMFFADNKALEFWVGFRRYTEEIVATLPCIDIATPQAPIWTCQYCQTVYANTGNCPGCGASDRDLTHTPAGGAVGKSFMLDFRRTSIEIVHGVEFYVRLDGIGMTTLPAQEGGMGLRYWVHLRGRRIYPVQ